MSELQSLVLHCHKYEELFSKVMNCNKDNLYSYRNDLLNGKVSSSFKKLLSDNGYKTLTAFYFCRPASEVSWYGVTLEGKSSEVVHFKLKYL